VQKNKKIRHYLQFIRDYYDIIYISTGKKWQYCEYIYNDNYAQFFEDYFLEVDSKCIY